MQIVRASVKNFGSYEDLDFNFNHKGLTLIYGAAGAGKSTLQDVPMWILYGVTAKNGHADDIRAWDSTNEPTHGLLEIITDRNEKLTIFRVRGSSSQQNDFYFHLTDQPDNKIRGKTSSETQALLVSRIGVSKEQYLLCSYYNEFSITSLFFLSSAAERRRLLVELANVSFATLLTEKVAEVKREKKVLLDQKRVEISNLEGRLKALEERLQSTIQLDSEWAEQHMKQVKELIAKATAEDQVYKKKIVYINEQIKELKKKQTKLANELSLLTSKCDKCNQPNAEWYRKEREATKLAHEVDLFVQKKEMRFTNVYEAQLQQVKEATNPHTIQIDKIQHQIDEAKRLLDTRLLASRDLEHILQSLDYLTKLAGEFKMQVLHKTVSDIETNLNALLNKFFDSLIQVQFTMEADDKIQVLLFRDSFECNFRQLSRGQRYLINLCFALSVMKATSNRIGIHFGNLFFDEALNGFDVDLKMKAFAAFQEISTNHESVFLIDHEPTFQNLFENKIKVSLIGNHSIFYEE